MPGTLPTHGDNSKNKTNILAILVHTSFNEKKSKKNYVGLNFDISEQLTGKSDSQHASSPGGWGLQINYQK